MADGTVAKFVDTAGNSHLIAPSALAICRTAAGTGAKDATIQNDAEFTLIDGITIYVLFTNGSNTAITSLNVNSTGAKQVDLLTGVGIAPNRIFSFTYTYGSDRWRIGGVPLVASENYNGLMSSQDYGKLAGIASGAEVNQNAFSNVKVGSTTVAADSKTDTLELVAGSNVTLTPDATNDKVTIAASNSTYTSVTGKPTANQTPSFGSTFTISQISQSTTGQITATDRTVTIPSSTATTSSAGLMSSTDKTKLNNMAYTSVEILTLTSGLTSVTSSVAFYNIIGYLAVDADTDEALFVNLAANGQGKGLFSITSAYDNDIEIRVMYLYVRI